MKSCDHLILGWGYSGKSLQSFVDQNNPDQLVVFTSRSQPGAVRFDLLNPETWAQLPSSKNTYWTFPAEPVESVKAFFKAHGSRLGNLVVVGSTGSLVVETPGQLVDETTALDMELSRVQGESFLRDMGARLLLSSGIYGPGRNPLKWLSQGWVGRSDKWVNMIHVEDLAQFLYQAAVLGKPGATYIASDNNPMSWNQVIDQWHDMGVAQDVPFKQSRRPSKKIDCSRSIKDLQVDLRFQNFAVAVGAGLLSE